MRGGEEGGGRRREEEEREVSSQDEQNSPLRKEVPSQPQPPWKDVSHLPPAILHLCVCESMPHVWLCACVEA